MVDRREALGSWFINLCASVQRNSKSIYFYRKDPLSEMDERRFEFLVALVAFACATGLSYLALTYLSGGPSPGPSPTPTEPSLPNLPYLSLGAGLGAFIITIVTWEVSKKVRGEAASVLLSEGPERGTVKDVEMVAHMIEREKFTVPEISEEVGITKSTVWRLVDKLNDLGLVEDTGEKRNSNATRGRPSKVYRYTGKEGEAGSE